MRWVQPRYQRSKRRQRSSLAGQEPAIEEHVTDERGHGEQPRPERGRETGRDERGPRAARTPEAESPVDLRDVALESVARVFPAGIHDRARRHEAGLDRRTDPLAALRV